MVAKFAVFLAAFVLAPQSALPAFDAVSIKPAQPGSAANFCVPHLAGCRRGSIWRATGAGVKDVIEDAYGLLNDAQVSGFPPAFDKAIFDFQATVAPDVPDDQFRLMLRSMLATRFSFAAHFETRQLKAYSLAASSSGLKLAPSPGPCAWNAIPGAAPEPGVRDCGPTNFGPIPARDASGAATGDTELRLSGYSFDELAAFFELRYAATVGDYLPVINRTGQPGRFDLDVKFFVPPAAGQDRESAAEHQAAFVVAMQKALHDQAGLDLDLLHPSLQSVPVLVIDHLVLPTPD